MGPKHLPAAGKHNMCGRMMTLQLIPPPLIHSPHNDLPNQLLPHFYIHIMQHAFPYLIHIYYSMFLVIENNIAGVVSLSTRGGIERGLVQDNYICFMGFPVFEDWEDFALETKFVWIVVCAFGFLEVGSVVELNFGGFSYLLLAVCDLVVKVAGNLLVGKLLNNVWGNSPRGNCDYPVVNWHVLIAFC